MLVIAIFLFGIQVSAQKWFSANSIEKNESNFVAKLGRNESTSQLESVKPSQSNFDFESNKYVLLTTNTKDTSSEKYLSRADGLFKPVEVSKTYLQPAPEVQALKESSPYNKSKSRIIRRRCSINQRLKKQHDSKQAKSRFLEVFQVVEFQHLSCVSSSGLEGVCLHEYECHSSGGSPMGTCADGYGTCCVTQFVCDGRSSASTGWFTNPGFPSPSSERLSCAVTLDKASDDVKQIRLDFANFELLPPTDGSCEQDQFVVSGQNINNIIPILCGINTRQHVYIEVGDVNGPIYLFVQTVSAESRLFSIKVTQLTSTDDLAAPTGCLQYFKDSQGYLESFNFRDKSDIGIARVSSYLNNLNYAMCIDRVAESCSVTYTNAGYMQIVNYDTDGLPIILPGQAGAEIYNCPSDWLLISALRLCGDRFNDGSILQDFSLDAPVTDNGAGPIIVWFRSDGGYVGRGFKLKYQQNICSRTV